MYRILQLLFVTLILVLVMGCSSQDKRKAEYQKAETLKKLEVPPDLLSFEGDDELAAATAPLGGSATFSEYSRAQEQNKKQVATTVNQPIVQPGPGPGRVEVGLPQQGDLHIGRDGGMWWLVVPGEPGDWWTYIKAFWAENGLPIQEENVALSVMETDWSDEQKVKIKSVLVKKFQALYDSNTRDKYITRLEASAETGKTEITISHRGMAQMEIGPAGDENNKVNWIVRRSDPELEIDMMKRLVIYLGGNSGAAEKLAAVATKPQQLAKLSRKDNGEMWLQLDMPYVEAWRRTGRNLGRLSITIEDFDKANGVYFVSGNLASKGDEKKGWLSGFFGGEEEDASSFQVTVKQVEDKARVRVFTKDGAPDNSSMAELFLRRLQDEFNQ